MKWFPRLDPGRLLLLSFVGLILAGAVLLKLPWSVRTDLSLLDALFTSASAVCVTGLNVVATPDTFTRFGQGVLILLMQLGGLGIMTFTAIVATVFRRRLSRLGRLVIQDTLSPEPLEDFWPLLRTLLRYTLLVESVGFLLLWWRFATRFPSAEAAWHALFHSVSAFCNAGFSTFGDNLLGWQGDWGVNLGVGGLIVLGGLGFIVVSEVADWGRQAARGERLRLSLHSKLALATTAFLIVAGALIFWGLEARNALDGMAPGQTVMASLFQSITPRTAGFNTVDYGLLSSATLFVTVGLMIVGGSPGSTAGGMKTTTFGLLVLLVRSKLRGENHVHAFRRGISDGTVQKAVGLLVVGLLVIGASSLLLAVTEGAAQPYRSEPVPFLAILFETTSALCTVGLSTGITPGLSVAGKWVVILLMYAGRVGPTTLLVAFTAAPARGKFEFAEESVMVG